MVNGMFGQQIGPSAGGRSGDWADPCDPRRLLRPFAPKPAGPASSLTAPGHLLDLGLQRRQQRSIHARGMSRTMKTRRVRRSAEGQRVEPGGRVEDVLDAVDDGRTVGALGDVDDALQAQEVAAAMLGERLQQQREGDGAGSAARAGWRSRKCPRRGRRHDRGRACGQASWAHAHRGRATPARRGRCAGRCRAPCRTAAPDRCRRTRPAARSADGLSAASLAANASLGRSCRSVLVRISRSATATCLTDSGWRVERAEPLTASTVVTTPASARRSREAGIAHQRVQDGRRIGEPAGLDDDALERRHAARRRAAAGCPPASAPGRRGPCSTGSRSAARRSSPRWSRSGRGRARPRRTR